jgi:hypothetical protein
VSRMPCRRLCLIRNCRWMPRDIRWNKHRNDLPKPETTGNGFWL